MMTLRICPKRDAVCPHGMDCQFVIDRFNCKDEPDSPVTPAPVGEVLSQGGLVTQEVLEALAFHVEAKNTLPPATAMMWIGRLLHEVDALREIVAEVAAPPSDTSGEAVAWRFRLLTHFRDDEWEVAARRPEFTTASAQKLVELEPLYPASALAAAEARGVREGLERAAKWHEDAAKSYTDPEVRSRQHVYYAAKIRSLSPAHKGSEN